ncbi:MAG: ATP synthase F1 subunit delta [bacterium]
MRDSRVAGRYAGALLAAALREKLSLADLAESYAGVRGVMDQHPDLPSFLGGPQVADDEKDALIISLFRDRVEEILVQFFLLLIRRNRIEYLVDIGKVFARLVEQEQGLQRAVVTTAVPLPDDLEQKLSEMLERLTGSKIIMKKNVDPAVFGGVSVKLGDRIIDGTLRTNLDKLAHQLGQARVH